MVGTRALALVVVLASCSASKTPASTGDSGAGAASSPAGTPGSGSANTTAGGSSNTTPLPPSTLPKGPGAYDPAFRTSSNFFTPMASPRDSNGIHGIVQVWYSTNIRSLMKTTPFVVPEGTVSIKTGDTSGGQGITEIVVMVKKAPGYDPANGDWAYELRDAQGAVQAEGKIADCIDCHRDHTKTDYLAATASE